MGINLMLVVGFIVFIIVILSVIKIETSKVTVLTNNLKIKITRLEKRIDEIESETKKYLIFYSRIGPFKGGRIF